MSDEAVAAVPGLPAPQYTLKYYLMYLDKVRERAAALRQGKGTTEGQVGTRSGQERAKQPDQALHSFHPSGSSSGQWTPQSLERALWTWTVGWKLCPDLLPDLDSCPAPGHPDSSPGAGATE